MKKVKLFCMQKDEDDILNEWILYHASIFGLENIYMIDNGSQEASLSILRHYQNQGLNLVSRPDYSRKGEYIYEMIRETECDLAIPLDLDEFIAVVNPKNIPIDIQVQWATQCLSFDEHYYKTPQVAEECKMHKETPFEHFLKRGFRNKRKVCSDEAIKPITSGQALQYCREHHHLMLKHLPEWAISCQRDQIWEELNQLPVYGRYAFFYYLTSLNTELEYINPVEEVTSFNLEDYSNFNGRGNYNKKFFLAKDLRGLDHGNHHGTVQDLFQSMLHESRLCMFHFHYRGIWKLIQKCKNDIKGLGYVKDINNQKELKKLVAEGVPGSHNIITYLQYLIKGPLSLSMNDEGSLQITSLAEKIKELGKPEI